MTSINRTTTAAAGANIPVALTYEQLIARANDHHASAAAFAELAGMELRPNGANLDLFKGHELITEGRPAEEIHHFLWGYVNGQDDADEVAADKALLLTEESDDGGANMLLAVQIADQHGWTIQVARTGITLKGINFTEHFAGLAGFFAFCNGFNNAIDNWSRVRGSNEANEAAQGSAA